MKTLSGEERQDAQIRRSWWRQAKIVLGSRYSERLGERIAVAIVMVIVILATKNAQRDADDTRYRQYFTTEILANREKTMQNRCLGFAILSELDPRRYPAPQWCAPVLARLATDKP